MIFIGPQPAHLNPHVERNERDWLETLRNGPPQNLPSVSRLLSRDLPLFGSAPQPSRTVEVTGPNPVRPTKLQAAILPAFTTYVSPPGNFAPGERKGHYRTGLAHAAIAPDGSMRIAYDDCAVAVVDEIENPKLGGKRFTVGY